MLMSRPNPPLHLHLPKKPWLRIMVLLQVVKFRDMNNNYLLYVSTSGINPRRDSLKQTTLDTSMMFRRSDRSASAAASASVQSIAVEEENLNSDSSDEPVRFGINELHDNSVVPRMLYF